MPMQAYSSFSNAREIVMRKLHLAGRRLIFVSFVYEASTSMNLNMLKEYPEENVKLRTILRAKNMGGA